jgi:hypothetical protein
MHGLIEAVPLPPLATRPDGLRLLYARYITYEI